MENDLSSNVRLRIDRVGGLAVRYSVLPNDKNRALIEELHRERRERERNEAR